jgi:hypothetical protein
MSLLIKNSMPAERAVGCSFAEQFRNNSEVVANGGTIYGTPTIDNGATLNGTTDYITHNLAGNEFNSDKISIVCEFWPARAANDGINSYLVDSDGGLGRVIVQKDVSNNLVIYVGLTTQILLASYAVYGDLWHVEQRNVLVISTDSSGSSVLWLNGIEIDTGATAWSSFAPLTLFEGARNNTTFKFEGKLGPLKIFKSLLTEQDAINEYNQTTYDYMSDSLIHLPMQAEQHDPTNLRTLDISGKANHAAFGVGVAEPTKLQKRGYLGDGGDHLELTLPVDLNSDFTIAGHFKANAASTDGFFSIRDGGSDGVYAYLDGASQEFRANYNGLSTACYVGQHKFTFVIAYDIDSYMSLYIDGVLRDIVDISGQTISITATTLFVMSLSTGNSPLVPLDGEAYQFIAAQKILTPLQVADLHINMIKRINRV